MKTILIGYLLLMIALTSSYASRSRFCPYEGEQAKALKELAEAQQGKGDTLKEIVGALHSLGVDKIHTMEESLNKLEGRIDVIEAKKVDRLQTLEESQNELSLAMNKLAVNLNLVVDVSVVMNRQASRLDVIEAKMDTQADEIENKLKATQNDSKHILKRVEDLGHQMSTQVDEMKNKLEVVRDNSKKDLQRVEAKLEAAQGRHEEVLQRVEDKLEAAQGTHKQVLQRVKDLELQVDKLQIIEENMSKLEGRLDVIEAKEKPSSKEVTIDGCLSPFESVGDDCLHWGNKGGMSNWEDAQRYCQTLGVDLFIPTVKEEYKVFNGTLPIPDPHPSPFNFLLEKIKLLKRESIFFWTGAYIDNGKLVWTSGEELEQMMNLLEKNTDLQCVRIRVYENETFSILAQPCKSGKYSPLCHQKKRKYTLSLRSDQITTNTAG